jgi:hypothetical protein
VKYILYLLKKCLYVTISNCVYSLCDNNTLRGIHKRIIDIGETGATCHRGMLSQGSWHMKRTNIIKKKLRNIKCVPIKVSNWHFREFCCDFNIFMIKRSLMDIKSKYLPVANF